MKRWRKLFIALGGLFLLLLLLFLFRYSILRGVGNVLICQDPIAKVDAMFVLSGNALDRGSEAAKLYQKGVTTRIICTGESIPGDIMALGLPYPESEITKREMLRVGVPDSAIELLRKGTSTKEEEQYILQYCEQNKLKHVMVVSSMFHTKRINRTFRVDFEKAGITLVLRGAPAGSYREDAWWKYEDGLIAVNNEWIKIFYYWLKY